MITSSNLKTRWIFFFSILALVFTSAAAIPAGSGSTTLASLATGGTQGNETSESPSISADGRYVVFWSAATNLVTGDTNGKIDIFVRDLQTGETTLISVGIGFIPADGDSYSSAISGDGRYVAFESLAANLVAGDTNGEADVFVHDRQTHQTMRVSVDSNGVQGNDGSYSPRISADGIYVAFTSYATNLVASDTNGVGDIFVYNLQTGETARVSRSLHNPQADDSSSSPSISADGRYVAFESYATNLVPNDTNSGRDIFVRDRQTGSIARITVASDGTQANNHSWGPAISGDGRYVAFSSTATNLVASDTNGYTDVFVHDLQTGDTNRISMDYVHRGPANGDSYNPAISYDGRFITFTSTATNLVAADNNGMTDIFLRDRGVGVGQTVRISVNSDFLQANNDSFVSSISATGHQVVYSSEATNLVHDDTNAHEDIFLYSWWEQIYLPFLRR